MVDHCCSLPLFGVANNELVPDLLPEDELDLMSCQLFGMFVKHPVFAGIFHGAVLDVAEPHTFGRVESRLKGV